METATKTQFVCTAVIAETNPLVIHECNAGFHSGVHVCACGCYWLDGDERPTHPEDIA